MATAPSQIDKYPVKQQVASGGMSAVYLGSHPTLDRPVILKKLTLSGDKSITERFRREARLLMDFRHDHIVDVFDHFVKGRSHYIVMEYVDGMSVKELIESQRYLDAPVAAYITLITCRALEYAHRKGVVHRDIKPANVLLSRDGEIKLADFGIASGGGGDETLTSDGATLGTPAYMAPEQFSNSRTVDFRADLYSLGVMLYEMLCGQKPFPGGFTPEVIQAIQKGRYIRPGKHNPSIPRVIKKLIRQLMLPSKDRRLSHMKRIQERLERFLSAYDGEAVVSRLGALVRNEEPTVLGRRRRPRPLLRWGIAAAVLLLAGLIGGYAAITDVHRVLLFPGEYGRLRIEFQGNRAPVSSIFVDDGREIPPVPATVRFIPQGDWQVSLPLVLPEGQYRIKTESGDRVVWNSIYLPSAARRSEGRRVFIAAEEPVARELTVRTEAADISRGGRVNVEVITEVLQGRAFIPIDRAESLMSGEVHHFRIRAEGYFTQEFVLRIDTRQRDVVLRADMVPLPGELRVAFPVGNRDFLFRIDGDSRAMIVEAGAVRRTELNLEARDRYPLLPGNYELFISGDGWQQSIQLELASGENRVLFINPAASTAELR